MWVTIQKVDLADARRATLWGVTRRTVAAAAATEPLRQVTITIRAEYADVARLVGEGMMVGFYNVLQAAGEAESLLLECIPETAFIVADDMVPSKSMTRSKSSSIIADRSPTTISSLEAEQRDLTLVATILAVSDNRPTATPAHPTQTSDRVALRVADGSGTIDVTVWDALARAARSLRPGMLVLLSNMHTSAPKMGTRATTR
ncbi:hypothetical protein BC828DRAFT_25808 [Blastocladiella britannica]|nr:hypothetical protein BC828DRAFT_25808 [Blastocladiella britannica]